MSATVETTLRTGGQPERVAVFAAAQDYLSQRPALGPHRVIGAGSNLVVSDAGPAGMIVVLSRSSGGVIDIHGNRVRLDAAGNWHETVLALGSRGLAGVESLVGIPGTVGGAVVQNIGAYGHELCEVIDRVKVLDRDDGSTAWLDRDDCGFGYRDSRFKSVERGRHVLLEVELDLLAGGTHVPAYRELALELERSVGHAGSHRNDPARYDPARYDLAQVHAAVLTLRRAKNMVWDSADPRTWGAGSFFVNPIVTDAGYADLVDRLGEEPPSWPVPAGQKVSAGWLVERAGFARGYRWSTVALAEGHALGLVNITGRASSQDVLDAANEIARAVTGTAGLRLFAEPVLLGFDPDVRLDFDAHIEP